MHFCMCSCVCPEKLLNFKLMIGKIWQFFFLYSAFAATFSKLGKCVQGNIVGDPRFPALNYSVSHHGDFVVLVSEPNSLVGVDIMVADAEDEEAPAEYIENFRACFTPLEWTNINSVGPDKRLLLDQFSR